MNQHLPTNTRASVVAKPTHFTQEPELTAPSLSLTPTPSGLGRSPSTRPAAHPFSHERHTHTFPVPPLATAGRLAAHRRPAHTHPSINRSAISQVAAPPVQYCRKRLAASTTARAVLINAGQANAATGEQGWQDALACAAAVAEALGVSADEVLLESTGVIGQRIKMAEFLAKIPDLAEGALGQNAVTSAGATLTQRNAHAEGAVGRRGKKMERRPPLQALPRRRCPALSSSAAGAQDCPPISPPQMPRPRPSAPQILFARFAECQAILSLASYALSAVLLPGFFLPRSPPRNPVRPATSGRRPRDDRRRARRSRRGHVQRVRNDPPEHGDDVVRRHLRRPSVRGRLAAACQARGAGVIQPDHRRR